MYAPIYDTWYLLVSQLNDFRRTNSVIWNTKYFAPFCTTKINSKAFETWKIHSDVI